MIKVSPRAHRNDDRAGDPLDGLVNLFDVGIVLAVAFLLAGLASIGASGALADRSTSRPRPSDAITVAPGQVVSTVPSAAPRTAGQGTEIGKVYRLRDGRLIYVVPSGSAVPVPTQVPTPTPTR